MLNRVPKGMIDRLAAVPLFAGCNRAELRTIARLGSLVSVPDRYVIIREGNRGTQFFLLLEGTVRCLINEKVVATLTTGDFFGEMALLGGGDRRATVVTSGSARILVIGGKEFNKLLDSSPTIAKKLLQSFVVRASENATFNY